MYIVLGSTPRAFAAKEKEPITPFLFKVKGLFTQLGISTVMVIGGSGDFFEVADVVLQFDKYQAYCVTEQAKEIARQFACGDTGKVTLGEGARERRMWRRKHVWREHFISPPYVDDSRLLWIVFRHIRLVLASKLT